MQSGENERVEKSMAGGKRTENIHGENKGNDFIGFTTEDVAVGTINKRLWMVEDNQVRMREELRELAGKVTECKQQNGGLDTGRILREIQEIREREKERERENKRLREQVKKMQDLNELNFEEIKKLKHENQELKKLAENGARMREGEVKDLLTGEVSCWKEEREQQKIYMKEILEKQQEENDRQMEKRVIKIIKEKENLVRDTVQKKLCVMVFGDKEKHQHMKDARERDEWKRAKEILRNIEEDDDIIDQIEEVTRMGKYIEKGARPMRIRFSSQYAAETVMAKKWKLARAAGMKDIWIRRAMNEEERIHHKELVEEAKAKNEERTQEEMKCFVWKVKDMRIRKWWLREARGETQQ